MPSSAVPPTRPANFKPDIPNKAHNHSLYGDWNSFQGKPTGGHLQRPDLGGTHHPGYSSGHGGGGTLPNSGKIVKRYPNGVPVYQNPRIQFGAGYGQKTKYNGHHSTFPPGTTPEQAKRYGNDVWNDEHTTFKPDKPGSNSGTFHGSTTIPGTGQKINITGYYQNGRVTSYFPNSSNQS